MKRQDVRFFLILALLVGAVYLSIRVAIDYDVRVVQDDQIWICDTYAKNWAYSCTEQTSGEWRWAVWVWGWPDFIPHTPSP